MKLIRTLSISAAALLLGACGGGHKVATGANAPTATSAIATTTLASTNTAGGVATTVAPVKGTPVTIDPQVDAITNEADQALAEVDKTLAAIDQSLKDAAANGD